MWKLVAPALILTACTTSTVTGTATVTVTQTPERVTVARIPESCAWAARVAAYMLHDWKEGRADIYERDFFHAPQGSAEYQRSLFELALLETKLRSDMYMNTADIRKCYAEHVGPS